MLLKVWVAYHRDFGHFLRRYFIWVLVAGAVFAFVSGVLFNSFLPFLLWPIWGVDVLRYYILNPKVHDAIPSHVRATVISVWGFMGEIQNIATVMALGLLAYYFGFGVAVTALAGYLISLLAFWGIIFKSSIKQFLR